MAMAVLVRFSVGVSTVVMATIAAVACGSEVVVEGPPSDDDSPPIATGSAPTPVPGVGGAGGTGSGVTTSVTTGVGGGSGKLCGSGQPPCPPSEFCDLPGESCAGQGVCTLRPQGCPEDCPGVCGCDGQAYCNGCSAQASGVDVGGDALCQ